MPSHPHNIPEQEHSIKARSHELFVEPNQVAAPKRTKPFTSYLRETPALPLSPLATSMLWILGILVVVLFLAALWRITHRRSAVARPQHARPKAERATSRVPGRSSPVLTDELVRGRMTLRRARGVRRMREGESRRSGVPVLGMQLLDELHVTGRLPGTG
jgi:hypothetical protein